MIMVEMEQVVQGNRSPFNPMQLQLLKMFSYVQTEEQMREIKAALSDYFFRKVETGMDMLCEKGEWNAEKEDSIRKEHIHTPYVY